MCTMDYPKFIVSSQKEESNSIQRVKIRSLHIIHIKRGLLNAYLLTLEFLLILKSTPECHDYIAVIENRTYVGNVTETRDIRLTPVKGTLSF